VLTATGLARLLRLTLRAVRDQLISLAHKRRDKSAPTQKVMTARGMAQYKLYRVATSVVSRNVV
jgi:hypothetical protein